MSFIKPRPRELLRRGISFRRELAAFVLLATLWAFSLNVFASGLFTLLQKLLSAWAAKHIGATVLLSVGVFILLSYLGASFLAWGFARTMEETKQFVIVLPVMAHTNSLELVPIESYRFTETLRLEGNSEDLLRSYQKAMKETPGRPMQGNLYRAVADSVLHGILAAFAHECSFLLSRDASFHGVDYSALGDHSGACQRVPVQGIADQSLFLPYGCNAQVRERPRDRYGKSTKEIFVQGPYGDITAVIWPQWAILGEYHQKSFELAKSKLRTTTKQYADRDLARLPALWIMEIPVELRVRFQNFWKPWTFLFRRFEIYASWIEHLLSRLEGRIAWEQFVDKQEPGRVENPVGARV